MDEAIASLRALFHLKADRTPAKAAAPVPSANGDMTAAIRSALARGPLPPGKLARATGIDRAALTLQLRALERDGVVVSTGKTTNRLITLAAAAAKEGL